jgi:hypothetical protein
MIKNFEIFEKIKWYYKGKFDNDPNEEDDYSKYETLNITGGDPGDTVICVKDSINDDYRGRFLSIKKGEIKIIKGISNKVYFVDTPDGWGAYPKDCFAKIEN